MIEFWCKSGRGLYDCLVPSSGRAKVHTYIHMWDVGTDTAQPGLAATRIRRIIYHGRKSAPIG